jgi:protein-tyrosine phosphatase
MPAQVIDLKRADDPRDAICRAVEFLAAGKLVALPTETVYGMAASALNPAAVERLIEAKQRGPGKALALAIKSADDALDYVPEMTSLAQRLARRCWPGPLTLVLDDAHPDSVIGRLPARVRDIVVPDGTVGLRVPAHESALQILRLSAGPLVLTSANLSGERDATTAGDVMSELGTHVDLVLDDGPCRFGQPSSVVRVVGNQFEMLREGVINQQTLRRMTVYQVVIVCTGNTCRSPMAEVLLKRRMARRLNCELDALEQHGLSIASAGMAATSGGLANESAVIAMEQLGLDLSHHTSQPVTEHLVRSADLILTMTASHRQSLISQWPYAAPRTFVLGGNNHDISDPVGHPLEVYQVCSQQIDDSLEAWEQRLAKEVAK